MTVALVVAEPSLDELAATANHEHALVLEAGVSMVEHAIKAGEALIAAKGLLPFGAWNQWLDARFEAGCKATARNYMRIARHRALLESCEPAGLVDALRLIAGADRSDRNLAREQEMKALRASGLTYKAIAEQVGVSPATVRRSLDSAARQAEHAYQRARRGEQRRALRKALQRDERERTVRATGGSIAESYGLVRRALQALEAGIAKEQGREAKLAMNAAMQRLYAAEDELVKSSKLSGPRSDVRAA
jgi:transposase